MGTILNLYNSFQNWSTDTSMHNLNMLLVGPTTLFFTQPKYKCTVQSMCFDLLIVQLQSTKVPYIILYLSISTRQINSCFFTAYIFTKTKNIFYQNSSFQLYSVYSVILVPCYILASTPITPTARQGPCPWQGVYSAVFILSHFYNGLYSQLSYPTSS